MWNCMVFNRVPSKQSLNAKIGGLTGLLYSSVRRVTMSRIKSGTGPGQIPIFLLDLVCSRSRASFLVVRGQVWGKSFSRYQA